MKLNLIRSRTNAIMPGEQDGKSLDKVDENSNNPPYKEFEDLVDKLFKKKSRLSDVNGDNYHIFTNPDSGKRHYLIESQTIYIKQQIEANAMHNSFLDSIGIGHLCHKTTSYFQDFDSIIESMERTPVTVVNGRWVKPEFKVDKGSFIEYVGKEGEVIIPEIKSQNSGVYQNFDSNLGKMFKLLAFSGTALAFAGCVTATKQASLYDAQPDLLTKQYTADEIAAVKQNFDANPLQYSQKLGNLLLWQMHQKSPEFALEFAQTPELNNGINAEEAKAMMSIYNLIKDLDIPPNLFVQKNQDEHDKIILEWHGINEKETNWDGFFYQSPQGKILDAKSIGFEQGEDGIDYEKLKKGELKWKSLSTLNDKDGIIITLKYPQGNKIVFDINGRMLSFTKLDMLKKDSLLFNEQNNLEGILIVKNSYNNTKLKRELYALKDMVLAGENDYRYSAPLQALLWGYMDGNFKEGENHLKNYINAVEFIKPIWGEMEGSRWDGFDEVTSRLNLPELIDYYEKDNIDYEYYCGDRKTNKSVFTSKHANCYDITEFTVECLRRAGYKAGNVLVDVGEGHNICYYWNKGKLFVMDNARPKRGILGPYNSFGEIPYKIIEFVH